MNHQDERELAYKIRHILDSAGEAISRKARDRLHAARQNALSHQRVAMTSLSLAGVGEMVGDVVLPHTRTLAMLLALAVGLIGTYYWNNFQQAAENAEIDSALLADDLPINAYLDRGFHTWLDHPVQSPSR